MHTFSNLLIVLLTITGEYRKRLYVYSRKCSLNMQLRSLAFGHSDSCCSILLSWVYRYISNQLYRIHFHIVLYYIVILNFSGVLFWHVYVTLELRWPEDLTWQQENLSWFPIVHRYFCSQKHSDRLWGPPSFVDTKDSFPGPKETGVHGWLFTPCSAEFWNVWSYTSTAKYLGMAWCIIKHTDNIFFCQ
jgi:hypothetical protein